MKTKLLKAILLFLAICSLGLSLNACGMHDHVHVYQYTTLKEVSCTENGIVYGICSCGQTIEQTVPAQGHVEVVEAGVVPTCTESGLTDGKHCKTCGEVLAVQEEVDALGYNFTNSNKCPNCDEMDIECFTFTLLSDDTYEIKAFKHKSRREIFPVGLCFC